MLSVRFENKKFAGAKKPEFHFFKIRFPASFPTPRYFKNSYQLSSHSESILPCKFFLLMMKINICQIQRNWRKKGILGEKFHPLRWKFSRSGIFQNLLPFCDPSKLALSSGPAQERELEAGALCRSQRNSEKKTWFSHTLGRKFRLNFAVGNWS